MSTPPVVPVISTRATPTEIRTAFERLRSYYVGVQREGGSVTVQDLINARIARFNKLGILVSDDFFEVPEGAGLTDEQLKLIEDMDKIVRGIAEDGVFSIVEKAQWKATWDNLGREAVGIQDQCIFLGLAVEIHKEEAHVDNSTVYNNWITKGLELVAYMLSPTGANWDDMTVNTDINAERFAEVWDDYFLTKQILLNTITSTIASEAALTVEQIAALLALDELIEGITEDGLFSSIEKLQWKATWDNLVTEATGITEQCVTIGLTTEGTKGNATSPSNVVEYNSWLSTGVTLYNYMLAPAPAGADWSVLTENTAIEKDVFEDNWSFYLLARQILLNKIAATIGLTPSQRADIEGANAIIYAISDDGIFSWVEKKTHRATWEGMVQEYGALSTQVTELGLTSATEWTSYNDACTKTGATPALKGLGPYMELFWGVAYADIDIDTTFASAGTTITEFRGKWSNYFLTKQVLINKIAAVSATTADWSKINDDNGLLTILKADVDAANSLVANIADDNIFSSPEKKAQQTNLNAVVKEHAELIAQATAWSVSSTACAASYTTLYNYMQPMMVDTETDSTIVRATFISYWEDYFTKKQQLANAISVKASTMSTWDLTANKPTTLAELDATAATDLSTARANAAAAITKLDEIASDSILTPGEKPTVIKEYEVITAEQTVIGAQATSYGITTEKTAYDAAITALTTYLTVTLTGWNVLSSSTTIVGTTFRTKFKDVYAARQTLLGKITSVSTVNQLAGSGVNVMPPRYATFEEAALPPFEILYGGTSLSQDPLAAISDKSLKVVTTTSVNTIKTSDFVIAVPPSKKWILSAYIYSNIDIPIDKIRYGLDTSTGSFYVARNTAINTPWQWVRISAVIDLSASSVTKFQFRIDILHAGATVWFDGIMLEAQIGTKTTPSVFHKPDNFLTIYTGALNATTNQSDTITNNAITTAAGTATWDGVTGVGKPESGATVGAPNGTYVGSTLAEVVEANAAAAGYDMTDLNADLASGVAAVLAGVGGDYRLDVNTASGYIIMKHKDAVYNGTASAGTNKPAIALSSTGIAMGYNRTSDGAWVNSVSISASGDAVFAGVINADGGTFKDVSVEGELDVSTSGVFKCRKSSFSDDVNPGWWMAYNGGLPEFSLGNPSSSIKFAPSTDVVITTPVINGVAVGSEPSILNWTYSGAFSSTDLDTVAWGSGTFRLSDTKTYSISSGNTGNMSAKTYIYFNPTASTTAFQTTTTYGTAIGQGKVLIAVAKNTSVTGSNAFFQVFGGGGGVMIGADEIAANSITAVEISSDYIYAGTISAGNITTGTIDAVISLTDSLTISTNGMIRSSGKDNYADTTDGFFLGWDTNAYKLNIGGSSSYIKWDGGALTIAGSISATGITAGTMNAAINMTSSGYISATGVNSSAWSGQVKFPTATYSIYTAIQGGIAGSSANRCGVLGTVSNTATGNSAGVVGMCLAATHGLGVIGYGGATGVYGTCATGGIAIHAQAFATTQIGLQVSGKVNLLQAATTGTATATLAVNKPGSNTTNGWIDIQLNGTVYYIPVWA